MDLKKVLYFCFTTPSAQLSPKGEGVPPRIANPRVKEGHLLPLGMPVFTPYRPLKDAKAPLKRPSFTPCYP